MNAGERARMTITAASLRMLHGLIALTFKYFKPGGLFARTQGLDFSVGVGVTVTLLAVFLLIFFLSQ